MKMLNISYFGNQICDAIPGNKASLSTLTLKPLCRGGVIFPGLSSAAGGPELPAERWTIPESAH